MKQRLFSIIAATILMISLSQTVFAQSETCISFSEEQADSIPCIDESEREAI